jgi:hypothetical protein
MVNARRIGVPPTPRAASSSDGVIDQTEKGPFVDHRPRSVRPVLDSPPARTDHLPHPHDPLPRPEDVTMSLTVDEHEQITPNTLLTMSSHEIARQVARCERLICANRASEREYALYISGTRELVRRTGGTP